MTSAISLGITLAVLLDAVIRRRDLFSPFRLYLLFHSLTFGIASLALHRAMTPFSGTTAVVYFGSGATYLIGTLLPPLVRAASTFRSAGPVVTAPTPYDWRRHFLFALAASLIYLTGIAMAVKGTGGLPAFADDVQEAIYAFMKFHWLAGLAISAAGIAMVMLFMGAVSGVKGSWTRKLSLLLLLIIAGVHILTLSRSAFIFFFMFAVVYYNFAVHRLSVLRIGSAILIVLASFSAIAYVKAQTLTAEFGVKGMGSGTLAKAIFMFPYLYVANNFWNLDYGINSGNDRDRHPTTFGFTTVSGILDGIYTGEFWGGGIRQSLGYDDIFHKSIQKVEGLNTVSYQWGLYKDFGVAGALVLPFLFGFWVSLLYGKVREGPTYANLAVYSFIAFVISFSWFLAFWESQVFVYSFLYLVLCTFVCRRPRPVEANGKIPAA